MKILKVAWNRWLKFSRIIGNFQGQVIFSIFYFILFAPVGLYMRYFGANSFKKAKGSTFSKWEYEDNLQKAKKQY